MARIVFVITGLATGGAEMMLLKLLQYIDLNRFEPLVVSLTTKGEIGPKIEDLGIPVHVLDMKPGMPSPIKFIRLVNLLRSIRADVIQTWMYHADLLGGVAARLAGYRCVVWGVRHSNLSRAENKLSTLIVVKTCAILSRVIPTEILFCSIRAKEAHEAFGYRPDKLHVIPNGFELDRFFEDADARAKLRAELGLPPSTPLAGLIGRFTPQKNHLGFLEAAALAVIQIPQVHFVLAGKDVDAGNTELQRAIFFHGLQNRVHLLGLREDIPYIMAGLDVLISSSSGEAFPNVLGEAMACGVPCVVTDVGDSADIVGNVGRVVSAGNMAKLANELVAILQMPMPQKKALGAKAHDRIAENYEVGSVVRRYEAFYANLPKVV